jgi:superfamily II DNA or RNA helicase/HKD family nuclease
LSISESVSEQLSNSLINGFVDCNLSSLEKYNPKLLVNDYKKGMKVLSTIENELRSCEEFYFSVAFITNSGIASLLSVLSELEEKGIRGRIITSQYQNFTEPVALRRLLKFKNIELRIVTEGNFHAKGYIFRHDDSYSFIIGSSNLTQNALSSNKEWNVKLSSLEQGTVMQNIIREFDYTFDNATVVDEPWVDTYERLYKSIKRANRKSAEEDEKVIPFRRINPNKMQVEALRAIQALRKDGKNKALLISATGTGKTYLSAFDVKEYSPRKFLYIVHREDIARASMASFRKILGYDIDAGFLTGGKRETKAQYVFATIQTLARDDTLYSFDKDEFDYILIDEVHRAGAPTYQKILDYFTPKFMLGMTATPERTDDYDIFSLFDHNVAYEIRLNKALEENMLVPFHYYGVSEIVVDGRLLDENTDFRWLICDERVHQIIEKAEFYGHDGERVKGLIFCSRTEEAEELSKKLNEKGYKTVALSGKSTQDERETAIRRLEQNEIRDHLDYILTVDIFNEGVDIPTVNQVIMLRPTQSAIVFVQQLGRGLRKHIEKEYLTVIDFIGNYSNNYMIPIALYGDRSYNKDTIRKLVNNGNRMIPGCSTVDFDSITKEKIYAAIDKASINGFYDLKKSYELVKYQLGRKPMMRDFVDIGAREPYAFVEKANSYYGFVQKADKRAAGEMSLEEKKLLEFYSKEILNGKRCIDGIALALLIQKGHVSFDDINNITDTRFGFTIDEKTFGSITNMLNGTFIKKDSLKQYGVKENVALQNGVIVMSGSYRSEISSGVLYEYLNDMIQYDFIRFEKNYEANLFDNGFILYSKYSRKDACRILNWDKNEEGTIFGYRVKHNTCPIFVTYNKKEDISSSTKYEDEFIDPHYFSWMTRSRVTLESPEMIAIRNSKESGLRIPLFIKKSDGEGTDFYYMGEVIYEKAAQKTIKNDKGEELDIVNILYRMKHEVEDSIYEYLES